MNIIVDSTFNPFSYRDLMLPVYDYKQAYEETEAAYSDLVTQTEAWKDIANRENSPEAYAMYKSYSDLLNAIVDDFSQGMNPRNRRQLLGMKRRYASEITPIARASEAMLAANALRDNAGPDAIFEVGRYNSIDDFLHGKTANNKFESRKDIAARTAALSQAVALSILEDPIIKQSMSPQFLEVIQKRGLGSLDELQAAIAGNPAAANRFAQIRNQMINQIGGLDRFDAAGRTAVEGAINEGLYAGLNNYQTSLQQNGEYMTKAQRVSAANDAARLLIAQALERDRVTDRRRSEGLEPLRVDPNGVRYFNNGMHSWTETPKQVTKKQGGKTMYKYKGSDGKERWYDKAGYTSIQNSDITLTPVNTYTRSALTPVQSAEDIKNPPKLGNILGVTNLRLSQEGQKSVYDKGTGGRVYSKDAIEGATQVTTLSRAEEIYVDYFLRDYPGVKKSNLKFYRQWVDSDGDVCSANTEGAKQVLLIADK